jgi:hypothetical protein
MPLEEEPRLHRYPAYVRESPYLEFAIAEGASMALAVQPDVAARELRPRRPRRV